MSNGRKFTRVTKADRVCASILAELMDQGLYDPDKDPTCSARMRALIATAERGLANVEVLRASDL